MPYTKEEIIARWQLDDYHFKETLGAGGLSKRKRRLTDDEFSIFEKVRSYFEQQKVSNYEEAASLFQQEMGGSSPITTAELFAQASEQGTLVSPSEAVKILQACALPEQEPYSSIQLDCFLEACDLFKRQGKSYEEITTHFGIDRELTVSSRLARLIASGTLASKEEILQIIDKAAEKAATDIPQAIGEVFVMHVIQHLEQSGSQTEFFTQIEERTLAEMEGKSPTPLSGANFQQNLLPPSNSKSTN